MKNTPANVGDQGFNSWVEKIPGGGNGNPLQYSCLENSTKTTGDKTKNTGISMDRGAWWATVHGVTKS